MAHQYIYTMKGLGKSYGPGQEVLKDIWLSFLPGAKIGVLGLNGAGKTKFLPGSDIWAVTRQPFVPMGSLVTCTRMSWPRERRS